MSCEYSNSLEELQQMVDEWDELIVVLHGSTSINTLIEDINSLKYKVDARTETLNSLDCLQIGAQNAFGFNSDELKDLKVVFLKSLRTNAELFDTIDYFKMRLDKTDKFAFDKMTKNEELKNIIDKYLFHLKCYCKERIEYVTNYLEVVLLLQRNNYMESRKTKIEDKLDGDHSADNFPSTIIDCLKFLEDEWLLIERYIEISCTSITLYRGLSRDEVNAYDELGGDFSGLTPRCNRNVKCETSALEHVLRIHRETPFISTTKSFSSAAYFAAKYVAELCIVDTKATGVIVDLTKESERIQHGFIPMSKGDNFARKFCEVLVKRGIHVSEIVEVHDVSQLISNYKKIEVCESEPSGPYHSKLDKFRKHLYKMILASSSSTSSSSRSKMDDLVREDMSTTENQLFYITRTGRKYHRVDGECSKKWDRYETNLSAREAKSRPRITGICNYCC